ncbi:MAG: S46 family peptidase [Owenweeksia sp.]|nr:S46 family peptidase [Owenweeksia sp.]
MFNLQFALQKSLVYLFTVILFSGSIQAREGMWLPFLIGQLNADEMTRMGMEISAEDIYSVNQSSLKDAIVHFGGGCTAELISDRGLLLTNHHCGYSRIQSHSSIENNYLKDGYWAMSAGEELTNPGLTASIVKFMEDVTNQVLTGVSEDLESAEREELIRANVDSLLASRQSDYELQILPFSYGNQYILIAKEKFKDVRLVGAPPSSIGKFGADTDNWMWPRHTGDFSLFRIYADANNKPAEFSPDNVPYQPLQHLKVNLSGFKPGDFTLVYGFPGTTKEYLPSNEMRYIIEAYDPVRINIREQLLEILDKKMRQSDATRIQYASKYASISNSWKKWKGEIKGMKRTNALGKKHQLEQEFTQALADNPAWQEAYGEVLPRLKELYEKRKPLMLERHIYIETNYFGNELIRHLLGYRQLIELYEQEKEEELAEAAAKKAEAIANFYEDYDAGLDQKGMQALLPIFLEGVHTEPYGETIAELKAYGSQ